MYINSGVPRDIFRAEISFHIEFIFDRRWH